MNKQVVVNLNIDTLINQIVVTNTSKEAFLELEEKVETALTNAIAKATDATDVAKLPIEDSQKDLSPYKQLMEIIRKWNKEWENFNNSPSAAKPLTLDQFIHNLSNLFVVTEKK